ncbi:MAG: single-stranded DNA-binding protein [Actinomycetota bacterium]|nr:single-stranded DNA-binding protein [Actinomycetota bacterium]
MHEPLITITGNVARPPKLRTVPTGHIVADFRVASTPRRLDKGAQTWSDGETIWFGVTVWRALAEHCAESLQTGDRVVVTGRLVARVWQGDDGVDHSALEIDATSVGLDLSRGKASFDRTTKLEIGEEPWARAADEDPETAEGYTAEPSDPSAPSDPSDRSETSGLGDPFRVTAPAA